MVARVKLEAFLARYADRPFEWGRDDCSLFIADWWRENHGIDPAANLRGTYASKSACHRLLRRAGGLELLVADLCRRVGTIETTEPVAGSFGVIGIGGRRIGGIFTGSEAGSFWAIRNEQIGFVTDPKVVRAWEI